jgi:hypothetical protein
LTGCDNLTADDLRQQAVVGVDVDAVNHDHGFLFDHGGCTLDVPGSSETPARGINVSGQIVGSYHDVGGIHDFRATPVP